MPCGEHGCYHFHQKGGTGTEGPVSGSVRKGLANEANGLKRERLGRGLEELDRCFLGTVHSFCATILRERPIEANLDPDFEELDDIEDALLLERAWDEYLVSVQNGSPELLEGLQELDVDVRDLQDYYRVLSTYTDVDVVIAHVPCPDMAAARQELYALLDWAEKAIPEEAPEHGWDSLQELLRTALRRRRIFDLDDDIVLLRLLADIDRSGGITLNRWNSPEDAKQAKDRFETFRNGYLEPALRQRREYRHAPIIEFILPAIAHYGELKMEKSRLNYQDLLINTATLLGQNPEVCAYFQGRYTHLMVDEFQDTDPIQAEIMFYLTGQEQSEKDWRMLQPRPGSLFVVGDPKQSIYRFRRADIDTYNEVKRLIVAGGGAVLHLTTNFRSLDALGEWANPVFRTLLSDNETRFQAAFEGLDTVRAVAGDYQCGLRKISIPKIKYHKAEEIARVDADRIAACISQALAGGMSFSRTDEERLAGLTEKPRPVDFLILMRYKANMDLYASALESRGIPYQIAGGEGFSQSPELLDLLKLLRSLLDPGDAVRLVAVLRGRFFGISDSRLYRFKRDGGSFDIYSDIPELAAGDRDVFTWAYEQLRRFREWTQNLPISAALDAIMAALGSVPAALTGELGRSRAGRLVQCLELLADAERKGKTSLVGLVERLANLVNVGIEEEINIAPWESDYVRIMNLHKAKGLEAPVVFLANPAKNASHTPAVHICRTDGTPRGFFVIENMRGYAREVLGQPVGWDAHCETEQQYLSAEENRLLYVAATRARDMLVVSTYEGKPEISPWGPFDVFLDDVPELDACGDDEEAAGAEKGMGLGTGDFDKAKDDIQTIRSIINVASYNHVPVTSFVHEKESAPTRVATRRGQSWGNVIHRLLDFCARGSAANIEVLAGRVLVEEGRDPATANIAVQEVVRVLGSPFWRRAVDSSQHYSEVPFYADIKIDKPEDKNEDTVISGTIDLVFKEEDGWVIADFKTDTVRGERQLDELAAYYAPQLEMYRKAWESVVAEPVRETGLYFTSVNRWVIVKV